MNGVNESIATSEGAATVATAPRHTRAKPAGIGGSF